MTPTITLPNGRTFNVVSSTPAKAGPRPKRGPAHRMIERPLDGKPVSSGTLTLTMVPPSVNSLFANAKKGRRKTLVYRNWKAFANSELRAQPSWHIPGKIVVEIRVGGSRADADNLAKAAMDSLVTAGRIVDDSPKYVVKSSVVHDPEIRGTLIKIEAV